MQESFQWDKEKNQANQKKHGVSFEEAEKVFREDPHLLILADKKHSNKEDRFYAVGKIKAGIVTVRFTLRNREIRIFGAGFWTNYRKRYLDRLNDIIS